MKLEKLLLEKLIRLGFFLAVSDQVVDTNFKHEITKGRMLIPVKG